MNAHWVPGFARRTVLGLGFGAAALLTLAVIALRATPNDVPEASGLETLEQVEAELRTLEERSAKLAAQIDRMERTDHIIVDTALNQLFLVSNGQVVLSSECSTGTGEELVDPLDGRRWTFETPRGQFRISSRSRNPVWRKPDWAFIEVGERPPANDRDRFEAGVLGDYALGFGDGYFIHGTLYTRLIGENVTHGCIRLGDEDLEKLVARTKVGTTLLII